ncbi:hypothetical protein MD484_g6925, partial [Candolleomyces efflorescens]
MAPRPVSWPRVDKAGFLGMVIETALLGIFFGLYYKTMSVLVERSRRDTLNLFSRPIFWVAIILCCAIIGNWVTGVAIAWRAFILPSETVFYFGPGTVQELYPSVARYLMAYDPWYVANSAFYIIVTVFADGFMAYRLHIVWDRNWWIIIPPVLMCISLVVTGSMVTWHFARSATSPIYTTAGSWATASFALTLACNLYSTSLIALRIFLSNRRLANSKTDRRGVLKITEILVECASLYSVFLIISLVTYAAGSNVCYISVAATNPIIGIIFCMIVTRVHDAAQKSEMRQTGMRSRSFSGERTPGPTSSFSQGIKVTTSRYQEGFATPTVSPGATRRTMANRNSVIASRTAEEEEMNREEFVEGDVTDVGSSVRSSYKRASGVPSILLNQCPREVGEEEQEEAGRKPNNTVDT